MSEYPENPGPLPAEKLCNKYNNPNPIKGKGALGNENTGKMYHEGTDRKSLVETLQKMLRDLKKYDLGSSGPNNDGVDGTFGNSTEDAVKQFQEEHKDWDSNALKIDGLVGPETADALNREMVGKWYDHYQTPVELVEGVPYHTVTSEFLSKGLSVETEGANKAKIFLVDQPGEDKHILFSVRLHDINCKPMSNASYRVVMTEIDAAGISDSKGWAHIRLPEDRCFDRLTLEWGSQEIDAVYTKDLMVDCQSGDEKQQAISKFHNLGYSEDVFHFEAAVRAFQHDYGIQGEVGLTDDSRLPPKTKEKLWSIYQKDNCDATTS